MGNSVSRRAGTKMRRCFRCNRALGIGVLCGCIVAANVEQHIGHEQSNLFYIDQPSKKDEPHIEHEAASLLARTQLTEQAGGARYVGMGWFTQPADLPRPKANLAAFSEWSTWVPEPPRQQPADLSWMTQSWNPPKTRRTAGGALETGSSGLGF